jgi:NADH-quinone oxidoreductase subunit M
MNELGFPILSVIVFLPLLGAIILALFFRVKDEGTMKGWALAVMSGNFLLSLVLLLYWQDTASMQFVENVPWVAGLGISYLVGIDGISLFLVLLTTLLMPLALLGGWRAVDKNVKGFLFFMLVLETGVLGVFTSLDLVLFYVFWEAMLIPAYFLIGLWGGERRRYAAMKFFLYTMAGSALMLIGILYLATASLQTGTGFTFNLLILRGVPLNYWEQIGLFIAFGLAFAVKAPLFPFHSWLPDAYGESVIPVTVVLAGVLSKMGIYGFLRLCLPLFPDAVPVFTPIIAVLALIGIIYGSLVALGQKNAKLLVAYSSVAHISLIILGVFVLNMQSAQGVLIQVVNHGLTVAILFLLLGMLYERRGTLEMSEMSGLWKIMPAFGFFLLVAILASVGLPGLNGFVGEFLILLGVFQINQTYAVFATLTIVLGAWYMFSLYRQIMQGPVDEGVDRNTGSVGMRDLSAWEAVALIPIVILIFVLGIFPNLVFNRTEPSASVLVGESQSASTTVMEPPDAAEDAGS